VIGISHDDVVENVDFQKLACSDDCVAHRQLPTGKPDAGDPPVRFGREWECFALLLSSSPSSDS